MAVVDLSPGARFFPGVDATRVDCPYCGTIAAGAQALVTPENISWSKPEYGFAYCVFRCDKCGDYVAVRLRKNGTMQANHFGVEVQSLTPLRSAAIGLSEATPEGIRAALVEAETCLSAGALVAGALVCRRALQLICRDQDVPRSNLAAEINGLALSDLLKETAHAIRLIGNEAAHPEPEEWDRVTAEDVRGLIDLGVEIAETLYEQPVRYKALRDRADEFRRSHDSSPASE